jgi:hypothetical protein
MRARTELAIALGAFLGLVLIALGTQRGRQGSLTTDRRASSLVAGPHGTRALAEVWERSGGRVIRWRRRPQALPDNVVTGAIVAVIQPSRNVAVNDAFGLLELSDDRAHLLVAGLGVGAIYTCLGYDLDFSILDAARVRGPSGVERRGVNSTFKARPDTARTVSAGLSERIPCPAIPVARVDRLLETTEGAPVLLRVHRRDSPRVILLLSDASLLGTLGLRAAELPEVLLLELRRHGRDLVFDEYHHVGAGGSLWRSALTWSTGSPWGWLAWQLAIVSFLAFVFGAVRFGTVRRTLPRERRSALEHVKALATALASANGHDVAIASLVAGLRRRLASAQGEGGTRSRRGKRDDWKAWAEHLAERSPDPAAREAARRLAAFAAPGQPDTAVRAAANAVEDVWEALHH